MSGQLQLGDALEIAILPFKEFMEQRASPEIVEQFFALREREYFEAEVANVPLSLLIPGFLLSELERAFQIGFLIFLPFLIIDLVVAAVLMSMGMMMVPPALVSLPFKLAFFVVADGWTLISTALVRSYF